MGDDLKTFDHGRGLRPNIPARRFHMIVFLDELLGFSGRAEDSAGSGGNFDTVGGRDEGAGLSAMLLLGSACYAAVFFLRAP